MSDTSPTLHTPGGEWVEIDPGEWYYFLPMPLTDAEVITRHRALSADILAVREREQQARAELLNWRVKRIDAVARHTSRHEVGDGRDLLSVAPKTREAIGALERELRDLERAFDRLIRELTELGVAYPVTLRKAQSDNVTQEKAA